MSTELLNEVITKVGGDVSTLPDNLRTTQLKALCEALGVDTSNMTDNLESSYFLKIINEYQGGGSGGGDTSQIDVFSEYLSGTVVEIENEHATNIPANAFLHCSNLDKVYFGKVIQIGEKGFYGLASLTEVDLPSVTHVYNNAFEGCSSLSVVKMPSAVRIYNYVFRGDTALGNLDLPNITQIGSESFNNSGLKSINAPKLTTIGQSAFYCCNNLTNVKFPSLSIVSITLFCGCENLEIVDLPYATSIQLQAFYSCPSLTSLILRRTDKICSLGGTNALSSTPIESGTGYIYVPRALVDTYKTATNWTTYANQFRALEDYTVDGTITGALDETKI